MRLIIPISLFILLLTILLPLILIRTPAPLVPIHESIAEPEPAEAPKGRQDESLTLQVLLGDAVYSMTMADFLFGAVAAEMPARFHPEALKAQAVAARTYTLHRTQVSPAPRHPEADVCGDYNCCKAFHSMDTLHARWGAGFDYYRAIIMRAIYETDGEILVYDDQPILAAFHAASYGYTEASGSIWGSVPYLQSVRSDEGEADVPRFLESETFTFSQFRTVALAQIPETVLEYDNIPNWILDPIYTESGRLAYLTIGGALVTGAQFRQMFSLRSTAIRFDFSDDGMTITTGGHGHGVGLSQFGANTMANQGKTYDTILHWYYTNVHFSSISKLFEPS